RHQTGFVGECAPSPNGFFGNDHRHQTGFSATITVTKRVFRAGCEGWERHQKRNSNPKLTSWAQKPERLKCGAGDAGPDRTPLVAPRIGSCVMLTLRSIWLPGRTMPFQ